MDDLNLINVTVDGFKDYVKLFFEMGEKTGSLTPIMGIGKSGVGKTESVYDLTKELGIGFCELRLVTMTEVDLLGIPTINEYNMTTWASNELLPNEKRDGPKGILVLDEITSASNTIRAAAYQLLDSKRALGNYKLPDGWIVVALGNGPNDGGVFQGMEYATMGRCRSFRIEPDLSTWKKWAIARGVNPTVLAFVSNMPDYLHKMDVDNIGGAFPCPRTWAAVSTALNYVEEMNGGKPIDSKMVMELVGSGVGADCAATFSAFYDYNRSMISVEDIIDGKASVDIGIIEPQVMYIIAQNLVRELSRELKLGKIGYDDFEEKTIKRVANACNWIVGVGRSSLDLAIMTLTDLSQNVKDFSTLVLSSKFDTYSPDFVQFAEDNKIVFSGGE